LVIIASKIEKEEGMSTDYIVPFNNLAVLDESLRMEYLAAMDKVMKHGRIILGPEVKELEKKISSFCERRFAVCVGSGTDALIVALMGLGIGRGDEVILGALSWIASANAVKMVGANPVFVDVDQSMNIDPNCVENAITSRTKAILAVDYTGKVCRMEELSAIAQRHGLFLIEDAAQAFGARRLNRPAGSFGDISCFSMNPMKVFGALGEAGAVVTNDSELNERLIELRYNGMRNRTKSYSIGLNARIDTLHAAVMLCRLNTFQTNLERRRYIASHYDALLNGKVSKPLRREGEFDTYFCYCIFSAQRDELFNKLTEAGIECKTREWDYLPQHPSLMGECVISAKRAKRFSSEMLCLPIGEHLTDNDVESVCTALNNANESL
jgi:dTDP-4-amino-4,6-dideoxygalactose transaminase